jgi:hypothetical protein
VYAAIYNNTITAQDIGYDAIAAYFTRAPRL